MASHPDIGTRQEAIGQWIAAQAGAKATVRNLRPMAGGASQEIWSLDLDLEGSGAPLDLVLRADMGGSLLNALTRGDEFRLLQIASRAGVKVPRPYWLCEDTALIGRSFYITERVKGETIGRKIVRDESLAKARGRLAAGMGEELAKIHSVTPENTDLSFLPPVDSAVPVGGRTAEHLTRLLDLFGEEPHPALELGLRWLRENSPPAGELSLVHGDFRIGNLMVGPEGLVAVLDWELTHVGDRYEDFAWPIVRFWRFGNNVKRLGGFADPREMFDAYEKATGRAVDTRRVHYWEVMGNAKWAIGARQQANRHLTGPQKSLELASIGRRVPEMELELLDLIEKGPRY